MKTVSGKIVCALFIGILFSCTQPVFAQPQGQKTYTLMFANTYTPGVLGWSFAPYPRFQEMVKEATGGRLTIELKQDLFPVAENLFGVIQKRSDMSIQWIPYVTGTFPILDFGSAPFFWQNGYQYEKAVNDPRIRKILDAEMKKHGVRILMHIASQVPPLGGALWSNVPMGKVEDFKGKKIRVAGTWASDCIKALGATPVTITGAEIADALSRGTVDAVYTSTVFGYATGMKDVTKYVNMWNISSVFDTVMVINEQSYQALPADLQQALDQTAKQFEGQSFLAVDVMYRYLATILEGMTQVVKPDKAELEKAMKLTQPAIDNWIKAAGPRGEELWSVAKEYAGSKQR
jgi:TRAP-type C4-dicarboxylate transport system substrate-binding protein